MKLPPYIKTMAKSLKIQDIIQKLKKLDCPLVCSGDNTWIEEMLFKPNFDRYHLMEWIFSKLGFHIPKADECQNSSEVKAKNLLAAISALGLCGKDDSKVIQGEASVEKQLSLWTLLVDILWKKCSLSMNRNDTTASSTNLDSSTIIAEQLEIQSHYINKLCDSVNFKHLFKEKVQLFPPYILKESKEVSSNHSSEYHSLEEIKSLVLPESNNSVSSSSIRNGIFDMDLCSDENEDSVIPRHERITKLEDDIGASLTKLQNHSESDFNRTYNDLKLYLNVPSDDIVDLGPEFKDAEIHLRKFLELKKSLSVVKSSETELRTLNSELLNFKLSNESLPGSLLGEYTNILKDASKR